MTTTSILRAIEDPFYPSEERDVIASSLITSWDRQMAKALREVMSVVNNSVGTPEPSVIDKIDATFRKHLSGDALVGSIENKLASSIESTFLRGGREEEANKASGGRTVRARKAGDVIYVIEDVTESGAIKILTEHLTITSSYFYDGNLSDSLKDEMLKWFEGEITREELVDNMKKLTNERLTGEKILSTSYFERLANLHVMKVRNIAKHSRGKALGASEYELVNPMDKRTSPICRELVGKKKRYKLADLDPVIKDMLAAKTVDEQVAAYPFWKSPDEDRPPIGPFHFGDCRTTQRNIYL